MRVLLAPDKFKGSLTAVEVCNRVRAGIHAVDAAIEVIAVPVADGGDGTVDAAVANGFQRISVRASGPTGVAIDTSYARRGEVAIVEMASVCGLSLLPGGRLQPLASSSYGLGEVVRAAVDAGARTVVLGIGGSASTDGGIGFLQALGAQVLGPDGSELARGGGSAPVHALDAAPALALLADVSLVVACDVANPLCGPNGAAAVYGPQKGADSEQIAMLDDWLRGFADVVAKTTGEDRADFAGTGAAGGMGFAAIAVLGGQLRPGIELILELVGFAAQLAGADLVITGEGALDEQTLAGKAPAGVAAAARVAGVPCVAVTGHTALSAPQLAASGIGRAYALTDLEPNVQRCIAEAGPLLQRLGADLARDWDLTDD